MDATSIEATILKFEPQLLLPVRVTCPDRLVVQTGFCQKSDSGISALAHDVTVLLIDTDF
jgi:hypothetical protein